MPCGLEGCGVIAVNKHAPRAVIGAMVNQNAWSRRRRWDAAEKTRGTFARERAPKDVGALQ